MTDKPLAEVKFSKLKECPILTARCIDPFVLQTWSMVCKRYMKHMEKKADVIVSFMTEGMMEPRLVAWYQGDQACINDLTLSEYLSELAAFVLERKWEHKLRQKILAAKQGD
ncbi:hypothetical protein M422DRAFT_176908 [Sphaerobolus stellatus SS14]|uniref:Uncharacterized protein n=1 Tax=Sphaerobolus stellatus (strain SS14) TaxID=990650 RepID=A0A0C9UTP2_SPHS4|nr:hypothetical protein M422DRAFT_176908 [Sphaerobolus stellatus SS14]